MSSMEMASTSANKLSYQMLIPETGSDDERERGMDPLQRWSVQRESNHSFFITPRDVMHCFLNQRLDQPLDGPAAGDDPDPRESVILRSKSWSRLRRVPIRKRFRLFKVPSWRRLWKKRVRLLYAKVITRFKEGQVHFGDLFAGNYLFTQVNPKPLKCLEKEFSLSKIA